MSPTSSVIQGKRILVTRAKEQAASFSEKISELGGIPIEIPLIKIQPPKNLEQIEQALADINRYDWLVFTSVNGVQYFFHFLEKYNICLQKGKQPKIAVVGKKTLQALEQRGITVDLIPEQFVAENLLEKLREKVTAGDSVLLARGNLARSLLPEKLREMGVHVNDLIIYETVLNYEKQAELKQLLKSRSLDIITFTSSSTVTNFVELLEGTGWRDWLDHTQIVCIGPITEKTALEAGMNVDIVAKEYTIAGIIEAIINSNVREGTINE